MESSERIKRIRSRVVRARVVNGTNSTLTLRLTMRTTGTLPTASGLGIRRWTRPRECVGNACCQTKSGNSA